MARAYGYGARPYRAGCVGLVVRARRPALADRTPRRHGRVMRLRRDVVRAACPAGCCEIGFGSGLNAARLPGRRSPRSTPWSRPTWRWRAVRRAPAPASAVPVERVGLDGQRLGGRGRVVRRRAVDVHAVHDPRRRGARCAEVRRVLRPGGALHVAGARPRARPAGGARGSAASNGLQRRVARRLPPDPRRARRWSTAAGFDASSGCDQAYLPGPGVGEAVDASCRRGHRGARVSDELGPRRSRPPTSSGWPTTVDPARPGALAGGGGRGARRRAAPAGQDDGGAGLARTSTGSCWCPATARSPGPSCARCSA